MPINLGAAATALTGAALQAAIRQAAAAAFPAPTPERSWIAFQNSVRVEEDHGVAVSTTLPAAPPDEKQRRPAWDAARGVLPQTQSRGGVLLPPADDYSLGAGVARGRATRAQRRVEPEAYVFLEGYALRVGFPVPCPELVDLNGKPLVNCNRLDRGEGFSQGVVATAVHPIYRAVWRIRYLASEALLAGDLAVPPNESMA